MDKDVFDISNIQLPNLSPRIIFIAIAVLFGLVVVLDSFYQVQPEEVAKVLPKMGGKVYIDSDAQGVMPLLPLETLRGLTGASGREGE